MIRPYKDSDYEQVKDLYHRTEWYGGIYDEARDSRERLANITTRDPEAILVYVEDTKIIATISIIDDGRVAMLYRFVVPPQNHHVAKSLYLQAKQLLKLRGHNQVLVYSAIDNEILDDRYLSLGMVKGGSYACFWSSL